jgi:ATP-binding cassette subfamily F protein 3
LIVFRENGVEVFDGSYQEFLEKGGWQDEKPAAPTEAAGAGAPVENPKAARKELRRRRSEISARRARSLKPIEDEMKRLEADIDRRDAEMAAWTQAMQTASETGDGAKIAAISQAMHACQKEIDRLFDALDRATREHERLNASFDRELQRFETTPDF